MTDDHRESDDGLDGSDEVAALFAQADGDETGRPPDWRGIWSEVRRRRRRRVIWAGTSGIVLLLAAGTLGAWWASAAREAVVGGPSSSVPAGRVEGEYRLFHVGTRISVVTTLETRLALTSASEAELESGEIWVAVDSRSGPVPFAVRTPDAVVSVKGTRFAVAFSRTEGTRVEVLEGRVEVDGNGRRIVLEGGADWRSGETVAGVLDTAARAVLVRLLGEGTPDSCEAGKPAEPPDTSTAPTTSPNVPATPVASVPAGREPVSAEPTATRGSPAVPAAGQPPAQPDGERMYAEAERAMAEGRMADATALLERIASLQPGSALSGTALIDLGARLRQLGRLDESSSAYRRYLEQQPAGAFRGEARIALCRIELRAGRTAGMRACYAAYLEEEPSGRYAEEASRGREEEADGQ